MLADTRHTEVSSVAAYMIPYCVISMPALLVGAPIRQFLTVHPAWFLALILAVGYWYGVRKAMKGGLTTSGIAWELVFAMAAASLLFLGINPASSLHDAGERYFALLGLQIASAFAIVIYRRRWDGGSLLAVGLSAVAILLPQLVPLSWYVSSMIFYVIFGVAALLLSLLWISPTAPSAPVDRALVMFTFYALAGAAGWWTAPPFHGPTVGLAMQKILSIAPVVWLCVVCAAYWLFRKSHNQYTGVCVLAITVVMLAIVSNAAVLYLALQKGSPASTLAAVVSDALPKALLLFVPVMLAARGWGSLQNSESKAR